MLIDTKKKMFNYILIIIINDHYFDSHTKLVHIEL